MSFLQQNGIQREKLVGLIRREIISKEKSTMLNNEQGLEPINDDELDTAAGGFMSIAEKKRVKELSPQAIAMSRLSARYLYPWMLSGLMGSSNQ